MSAVRETVMSRIYLVTVEQTSREIVAESAPDLAAQLQALSGHARAAQLAKLVWQDDHAQVTVGALRVVAVGRVVRQVWSSPPPRSRALKRTPSESPSGSTSEPAAPDDDALTFFDRLDRA